MVSSVAFFKIVLVLKSVLSYAIQIHISCGELKFYSGDSASQPLPTSCLYLSEKQRIYLLPVVGRRFLTLRQLCMHPCCRFCFYENWRTTTDRLWLWQFYSCVKLKTADVWNNREQKLDRGIAEKRVYRLRVFITILIVVLLVLNWSCCYLVCAYLRCSIVRMHNFLVNRVSLNMNVVSNRHFKTFLTTETDSQSVSGLTTV